MGPLVGKIIVDIGKTIGKALLAGVGMEMAKVAGDHLRKRLGPRADEVEDPDGDDKTPEEIRAENARLKAEVDRLREELAAAKSPEPAR